jgi:hypothetical protein
MISKDFVEAALLCNKDILKGIIPVEDYSVVLFLKRQDSYEFKVFKHKYEILSFLKPEVRARCLGCLKIVDKETVSLYRFMNGWFHIIKVEK